MIVVTKRNIPCTYETSSSAQGNLIKLFFVRQKDMGSIQ